jgi:hypothetical protein
MNNAPQKPREDNGNGERHVYLKDRKWLWFDFEMWAFLLVGLALLVAWII